MTILIHQSCEVAGSVGQRRNAAMEAARAEALRAQNGVDPDSWPPGVGTCTYGPGCLALALAGELDQVGLERLRSLGQDVRKLAHTEFVIDCSALTGCRPAVARILARLRIQCLTIGASVELYGVPETLAADIGARPATKFTLDPG